MAVIKLEDVQAVAKQHGWTVVSDSYKNLTTTMEFICNKGHTVRKNFRSIRDNCICPTCDNDPYLRASIENIKLPNKNKNTFRVLAIDQATTISGWSIYDGKELVNYGIIHPRDDYDTVLRISIVKKWVTNMIEYAQPDLIILEDIQLQDFSGGRSGGYTKSHTNTIGITTFKVLAKLMGIIENIAFENNIDCKVIISSTWRSFNGVTGRTRPDKKKSAQLKVEELYKIRVSQDEADAICLGRFGAHHYSKPVKMISWE